MEPRPARNGWTDRELRSLSTAELLDLIQSDIRNLDQEWQQRRKNAPPPAPQPEPASKPGKRGRKGTPAPDPEPPEEIEEAVQFHVVMCCNMELGAFPAFARIRCPYCEAWHRAGNFPAHIGSTEAKRPD